MKAFHNKNPISPQTKGEAKIIGGLGGGMNAGGTLTRKIEKQVLQGRE